ncbi:MAG: hypothetical protein U0641_18125 [Anaerolineae bacterium]
MLDFRMTARKLTQGRPEATMTYAPAASLGKGITDTVRQAEQGEQREASAGGAASSQGADPEAVARRVYALMRDELLVNRERAGPHRL